MTLCIAAYAGEFREGSFKRSIVFCSDKRIETATAGSETEYKFHKVTNDWAAMIAGDVGRAEELLNIFTEQLRDKPFDGNTVINELRRGPQELKKRLANEYVSNMTGLSLEDFIARGESSMPPGLFENVWNDIARLEIRCQMLLIPTNALADQIYVVDTDGSVHYRNNFCTIGSGSSNADAWLHYRRQNKFSTFNQTISHVLEAKRFSEIAPGVGIETNLAVLDSSNNLHHTMQIDKVKNRVWKHSGARPVVADKPYVTLIEGRGTPWTTTGIG